MVEITVFTRHGQAPCSMSWCYRVIRVGFLLSYVMEFQERCIDLLDIRLLPPALSIRGILASGVRLLPWTILRSLSTGGRPLRSLQWVVRPFINMRDTHVAH